MGIKSRAFCWNRYVADTIICVQIFEPCGPVRCHGDLDTRPSRPAKSPQEWRFGRAVDELRQGQLIVGPSESPSRIKEPIARSVTHAAKHGAERQYGLAIAFGAQRWGRKRGGATNGEPGKIWKVRKRCIGLDAKDETVWKHIVVADLKALEAASSL